MGDPQGKKNIEEKLQSFLSFAWINPIPNDKF